MSEAVKANLIDEKKLVTIMKRFLGTKEADPDVTKYYRVENGLNYMATTFGSAVQILFENNYAGTFTKGTGEDFFRKPLPKDKYEDVENIPEMETIPDGKKKIKVPTGRIIEYPNIPEMFSKHDFNSYQVININSDYIDYFISVHEAMEKIKKLGGLYNTAKMELADNELKFSLYDSPVKFEWTYVIDTEVKVDFGSYHYDFSLMTSILKSLKDLKVEEINMYVKSESDPILFAGGTAEYSFKFAMNRKLTGEAKG